MGDVKTYYGKSTPVLRPGLQMQSGVELQSRKLKRESSPSSAELMK